MKKLMLIMCAAVMVACQTKTPLKQAVDTLASVGQTANTAYEAYLMAVVQGTAPTNDVPKVTAYYRDFQASFAVAEASAHFATNATLASPDLVDALSKLTTAISVAKGH